VNENKLTGVPSGFARLDEITGGFQKSDLIVVASRPCMGKTSFAINIARNASLAKNLNVLLFALQWKRETIKIRLQLLDKGKELQMPTNLVVVDYLYDAMDIMDECQRRKADNDIDLIIIDCFDLIYFCGVNENQQKCEYLPQYLKQIARTMECPVIVLSNLSRTLESRECKRPRLSDFETSGHIIKYSDLVLFLYRDDYYNFDINNSEKDICEVIVAKNKKGSTGTAQLEFVEKNLLFCDEKM